MPDAHVRRASTIEAPLPSLAGGTHAVQAASPSMTQLVEYPAVGSFAMVGAHQVGEGLDLQLGLLADAVEFDLVLAVLCCSRSGLPRRSLASEACLLRTCLLLRVSETGRLTIAYH